MVALVNRGADHREAARLLVAEGHCAAPPSLRTIERILAEGKKHQRPVKIGTPAATSSAVSGAMEALSAGTPESLDKWAMRLEELATTAAENGEVRSLATLLTVQTKIVEKLAGIRRQDLAATGQAPVTGAMMELAAANSRAALAGFVERMAAGLPTTLTPASLAELGPERAKEALATLSPRQVQKLAGQCERHELHDLIGQCLDLLGQIPRDLEGLDLEGLDSATRELGRASTVLGAEAQPS